MTRSSRSLRWWACLGLPILLITSNSCNVFDPLDNPSGDEQLLSAARACLDRGDLACARENYRKMSTTNEVAQSELAFAILDEQGASISDFMTMVGDLADGKTGLALTKFGERMAAKGGNGEARRLAIYQAYRIKDQITQNTSLRGFVEFTTGIALAAEILAEITPASGTLRQSDIVNDPTACKALSPCPANLGDSTSLQNFVNGNNSTACASPSGSKLSADASTSLTTAEPTGTNPTLDQLYDALSLALNGLSAIGAGGKFDSASGTLSSLLDVSRPSDTTQVTVGAQTLEIASDKYYRQTLINYAIGRE